MLAALENFLRPAVEAALGSVATRLGPESPGGNGAVVVHARRLSIAPVGADEGPEATPHTQSLHDWPAEAGRLDYALPEEVVGEVIEVEAPLGFTLRPGDAYYVDDRTIRFYRPPGVRVRARVRGAATRGWTRRRAATIELELAGWASSRDEADRRLAAAASATLAELARVPNLELESEIDAVWLRMLVRRVSVRGCAREQVDALLCASMVIELAGELDELVASGEPEPSSTIRAIAGHVAALGRGPASQQAVALGAASTQAEPGPGSRAIEDQSIRVLSSLNAAHRSSLQARSLTTLAELAAQDPDALPAELRVFVERARLVLALAPAPALPDELLRRSLADLLATPSAALAGSLDISLTQAADVIESFALLPLLLIRTALEQLVVADWLASPSPARGAQTADAADIRTRDVLLLRLLSEAERRALRAVGVERLGELAELDADALAPRLPELGLAGLRQLAKQARRVVAALELDALPAGAADSTLASLHALSEPALADALALGPAETQQLHAQLSTLQVLLKDSAFSSLTLREWVPLAA